MKTGDRVFNGHSYFIVGKVKDGRFQARLKSAFFVGSVYDYHFSEELDAWVMNSEPARTGRVSRRKA